MGRTPCCTLGDLKRGAWTSEEDRILKAYIKTHGEGRWRSLPKKAGLKRCGKSCRLRWLNYLRPDIKRGNITVEEEDLIIRLHKLIGNRWSLIAGRLPGRTDNEIKNYWNTCLRKKVESQKQHEGWNSGMTAPSARRNPMCSTIMVSNLHHFMGKNIAERNSVKAQLVQPEEAQELASNAPFFTPQEESWWDLLRNVDAGDDLAMRSSSFSFVSFCGDESPCINDYFGPDEMFEEMMIGSAGANLDLELETVASFLNYED
ncbi:hypothetical protein Cni_G29001 [Canna indica]|uniref:Uncharacterized protein n=1 Tax=Canna indica TaxID=4628 RepID=A0AAQ3L7I8_9LILI|nr:hypothetical protein Cni_G29001 [Canna indica]